MNAEWSNLNHNMQILLKRKETFAEGIATLLQLREKLMIQINEFNALLDPEDFSAIPFLNATGYHNKTIAYSLYHIARIEDIVTNTLIQKSEQIFFRDQYQERLNASIITTGNELKKAKISDFSSKLNLVQLYCYINAVNNNTAQLLARLTYQDLKTKMTDQDKDLLKLLGVVSEDETAAWLIDYWCSKDVKGLLQMPLSRHWIMHVEASMRILNKLRPFATNQDI